MRKAVEVPSMDIIFTVPKFNQLKREYDKAMRDNLDVFTFEDRAVVTTYAKYLIEYLRHELEGAHQ